MLKQINTVKLEGAQTGATQWQDQGLHKDIKAVLNQLKQELYMKNLSFEDDCANNLNKPICHTKNGKPKSFAQPLQCKLLAQALETVRNEEKKLELYLQQLQQTGYLYYSERAVTEEKYLRHLTSAMENCLSDVACGSILPCNPFEKTCQELLSYKWKTGPKTTDMGKTTRSYTAEEALFYQQNMKNSKQFESSSSGLLNNKEFFNIVDQTVARLKTQIVETYKFPKKADAASRDSLHLFWKITQEFDFSAEFLKTAQQLKSDNSLSLSQVLQSHTFQEKIQTKMQLLRELNKYQK